MKDKIDEQLKIIEEAVTSGSAELSRITLLDGSRDTNLDDEKWSAINNLQKAAHEVGKVFEK